VARALEDARPQLDERGAAAAIVAVEGRQVRIALRVRAGSCASTTAGLRGAVERAIAARAPEIDAVAFDEDGPQPPTSFVPLASLRSRAREGAGREPT
jgi:Fe-S cluster biogenesis protein NfuA